MTVVVRIEVRSWVLWTVEVTEDGTRTTVVRVGIVFVEVSMPSSRFGVHKRLKLRLGQQEHEEITRDAH